MIFFTVAWILFGILALGPAAFIFLYMKRSSKKPWPTKVDNNYRPKISIIVPTYNESSIILFKLSNLSRVKYPKNLMEIIIVDSNSSDGTPEIIKQFCEKEQQTNIKVLVEKERKGKSHALNYALDHCNGEVVIVSDADCFWPSDILEKAIPFLADPVVGVIGGPKFLLNYNQNWVTKMEEGYLRSANLLRLGESKSGSTLFFEGGFSAFKKEAFERFDPYHTGSDDCGTAIRIIENNFKAMLVPEAKFFSTFPESLRSKLDVKLRRINQLLRVFAKYLELIIAGKLVATRKTVIPNTLLYLFSPVAFVFFLILTVFFILNFPFMLILFVFFAVPTVRFYVYEIFESNILLLAAIFGVIMGKEFSIWGKPEDRKWLKKEALEQFNLI